MRKSDTAHVFGLTFYNGSLEEFVHILLEKLDIFTTGITSHKLTVVFTPNPEQIVLAHKDLAFAALLKQADYLLPDGSKLVDASRVLALFKKADALQTRITGVDVAEQLLKKLSEKTESQGKVLLIGGKGYHAQEVVGGVQLQWLEGYHSVAAPTPAEEAHLRSAIAEMKPDVVFVAFGAPYQEKWVTEHRQLLTESHVKIVMVVGGAFDILLGKIKRAPRWMQRAGLEWLYRLIQQPWRWKRQLQLLNFVIIFFRELCSLT